VAPDLVEAEQFEMAEQEGRDENDHPAGREQAPQDRRPGRIVDVPQHRPERPPEQEEDDQDEAGEQHIGAPLDRFRDDPGPGPLEALARHHAVLDPEQSDQGDVDEDRGRQRPGDAAAVDGAVHPGQIADEGDQIEKGPEEDQICDEAEQQIDRARHGRLPSCILRRA
jgi:hypothetical protein